MNNYICIVSWLEITATGSTGMKIKLIVLSWQHFTVLLDNLQCIAYAFSYNLPVRNYSHENAFFVSVNRWLGSFEFHRSTISLSIPP